MNAGCPKCGHVRSNADQAPEYECPRCGIVYQKYRQTAETISRHPVPELPIAENAGQDGASDKTCGSTKRRYGYRHVFAILCIIVLASLMMKLFLWPPDKGKPSAASQIPAHNFAYDIRGKYVGLGHENRSGRDFAYNAEIIIGADYRVASATWTTRRAADMEATARWSQPANIEYSCQRKRSSERLTLNDRHLSVSMAVEEEEGSVPAVSKFDLVYDYDAKQVAGNARPDGDFHIDPENGCLTATISAAIPPIQSARITERELDIEFAKWTLMKAVDEALPHTFEGKLGLAPGIGKPFVSGIVTEFTLRNGTLNFWITPLPFTCNVKMQNSFRRTSDDVSILYPEDVTYTLTTELVDWDIEIAFCQDGAMYVLNKDVSSGKSGYGKDQIYLKSLLEKVE